MILFILIAPAIYYLKNNLSEFTQLRLVNPLYIVVITAIFVLTLFFNGLLLKDLMKPFGIRIKNLEAFGLAVITNFYNVVTPFRGGAGIRAFYLKKKYEFPYTYFIATLGAVYVIIFLISSLGGLLSMGYIWMRHGMFNKLIFSVFLASSLFLLTIMIFSPRINENKNKWANRFIKVINSWHLIKNNRKIVLATLFNAFVQLMLGALAFLIAYNMFGVKIGFFKALFIGSVSSLSMILAITPGNLGVGDAINVFSAKIIGVGLTEAIAATVLLRAINLVVILILGPFFSYILLKHKLNQNEK